MKFTRQSKYKNVRTEVDGITFASKKEAKRYGELRLMQKAGVIDHLKTHPAFPLVINDECVCSYIADFCYNLPDGKLVVEDCKGFKTDVYKLKAKLMKAVHGIDVVEI